MLDCLGQKPIRKGVIFMAELETQVDLVWTKALQDEEYRNKVLANPVVELKKAGIDDVPDDLKVELKDGQLTFSTSDQLALEQLESRITKSK